MSATTPSINTPVNPQVTDAVTQSNSVPTYGQAPAMALAYLYQVTACVLANAAQNAVSAQQQSAITAQAATTEAVVQLYAIDTANKSPALDAAPSSRDMATAAALPETLAHGAGVAAPHHVVGFDHAGPWAHAAHELMGAVASALREFEQVAQETNMATIKQAATTAVLANMIKAPERFEQYQKILDLIEEL